MLLSPNSGRDPDAIAEARKLTETYLQNPGSVPNELVVPAFALAASNGGSDLYEKVMAGTKNAQTPEQYYLYFYTLPSFSEPELVQRTLAFAVSPDVRSQDSLGLIGAVMGNPDAEKIALDFVRSHWAEVEKAGGPFASAQVQGSVASFCDSAMKNQVQEFFSAHPSEAAERTFRQSMERITNCIDMKTEQSNQLASWLRGQGGSSVGVGAAR